MKLDWKPNHDPRSCNYQVPRQASTRTSRLWRLRNPVLDQGAEGACVGHGVANACSFTGMKVSLPHPQATAFGMYYGSRRIDEWEGEDYDGTSVLAGCKIAVELGFASAYRWTMGVEAMIECVLEEGPEVVGIPWMSDMFTPTPEGVIRATGYIRGGHCVCVRGYSRRSGLFRIRQSWGPDHGYKGDVFLPDADMDLLLRQEGEAAILLP